MRNLVNVENYFRRSFVANRGTSMSLHVDFSICRPPRKGRCRTLGCLRPLSPMGDLCVTHARMACWTGAAGIPNLRGERTPFIRSAKVLLSLDIAPSRCTSPKAEANRARRIAQRIAQAEANTAVLSPVHQLLLTCTPFLVRQRTYLRHGFTTKQKVQCLLAHIHKRLGDKAALRILAAACGTASMTMPTSSPTYFKVQIARAIYGLCRCEQYALYGRTYKARIVLNYRMSLALFKLIDPLIYWWMKDGGKRKINERVAKMAAKANRVRANRTPDQYRAMAARTQHMREVRRLKRSPNY